MIETKWRKKQSADYKLIEELSKKTNLSKQMIQLLYNKGLKTENDIKKYIEPSMNDFYDPFLMKDMDKAVDRIISAIKNKEKMTIFGDFDCDGNSATSLTVRVLRDLGANVDYYIPDRMTEGYGVNKNAVKKIHEQGSKLIVTVDCGITAGAEVDYGKTLGVDFVITDHHEAGKKEFDDESGIEEPKESDSKIPNNAIAVVDPKQKDCRYPFKGLAGVGVAYKLLTAIITKLENPPMTKKLAEYLDIVCFGTVADLVPLQEENRIIVKCGLEILNSDKAIEGFKALKKVAGLQDTTITTGILSFGLCPRINSLGRIASGSAGVRLMTSHNDTEIEEIATMAEAKNKERQEVEETILQEALTMIAPPEEYNENAIVLASKNWHQGVQGIVASKIVEKYNRPTILGSIKENGDIHCSGRSIEGFNLYNGLVDCKSYLGKFGGHEMAAGLSLNEKNLNKFRDLFNKAVDKQLKPEDFIPKIKIDMDIDIADINMDLFEEIKIMEPFGMGNSQPVFSCTNTSLLQDAKAMGKHNQYLRLYAFKGGSNAQCVMWNNGDIADGLRKDDKLDIAFKIGINEYQGRKNIQLTLADFKANVNTKEYVERFYKDINSFTNKAKMQETRESFIRDFIEKREKLSGNTTYIDLRNSQNKAQEMLKILNLNEPTLVYVYNNEQTIQMAAYLRKIFPLTNENRIMYYNGGLNYFEKMQIKKMFTNNEIQIIVTTAANSNDFDDIGIKHFICYGFNHWSYDYFDQVKLTMQNKDSKMYLLYNDKDVMNAQDTIRQEQIDKNELAYLYMILKHISSNKDSNSLSVNELFGMLQSKFKENDYDNYKIGKMLKILSELKLFRILFYGDSITVDDNNYSGDKLSLERSKTFKINKCKIVDYANMIFNDNLIEQTNAS